MKMTAMIPARMGSQRLAKKNMRELGGVSLIARAIRKCIASDCFDEVWVNSENEAFREIAINEGARFHQRPEALGNNDATHEQYIAEFLDAHRCDFVVQVHSIAPLLSLADIRGFVDTLSKDEFDVLLSVDPIQLECLYQEKPVNFSFETKTNSQDLDPVLRLSWSITAWRSKTFLAAARQGTCATYAGRIGHVAVNRFAGHVIKTESDLRIAEALLPLVNDA
jgi:CMP-N-acetylneuraminic acid synthetase